MVSTFSFLQEMIAVVTKSRVSNHGFSTNFFIRIEFVSLFVRAGLEIKFCYKYQKSSLQK